MSGKTGNRFILFKRTDGLWYWRLCGSHYPRGSIAQSSRGYRSPSAAKKINTVSAQRHAWCGHREMENSASRLIAQM